MASFDGFPAETFTFLAGLEANNSKEWFDDHRADYDTHLIAPALDFIAALAPAAQALNPPHQAVPKMNGSLRRLHRDLRFSKDKTPFSPRLHMVFWHGAHPNRAPAIHLVLHGDSLGVGVGQWGMETKTLAAYRAALATPKKLTALKAALKSADNVGATLESASLKRLPKGVESLGEDDALLLRKGLVARSQNKPPVPSALLGTGAIDYAAGLLGALAPVSAWLVAETA